MPDFTYERKAGAGQGRIVVGIDEAGRGPLAGPVVAAAALLDFRKFPRSLRTKVDDSKKLTPERREYLYDRLQNHALIGVGMASCIEIDRINILRASLLAMRRALDALGFAPDHALVDGTVCPDLPCASTARALASTSKADSVPSRAMPSASRIGLRRPETSSPACCPRPADGHRPSRTACGSR